MATRALRTSSVLLVSDALDERDVYAPTLRSYGYRVVNAATSVAAYQIAVTRGTDIVVTHVHIAGSMSGLELTRRLRIHTRTTTVPLKAGAWNRERWPICRRHFRRRPVKEPENDCGASPVGFVPIRRASSVN